jgi:hypothetical protein
MRTRAAIVALTTLLLTGHAARSLAQPRPSGASGDAGSSALARTRFSEGVAFAKKKEWQRAYGAFLEAWKLKAHPQIALNLGRAEIETGKYRDAMEHLQYCVDHAEAGDPDLKLARDWLAEARQKAGKLAIAVDVAGADVLVDGVLEGKAPLPGPVLVDPGKHLVEVTRGQQRAERSVQVETGGSVVVELRLPPETPSSPSSRADSPPPSSTPLRTVALIGGAAGTLAGLAVGATLGALSLQKQAERNVCTTQTERACWGPIEAERAAMARGSLGGFIGAGLFAAGTAAVLLFVPRQPAVVVAPAASAEGAGLVAAGRF